MGAYASGGKYTLAKHIRYMSEKLVEVSQGRNKHVMFFLPPRHSKSSLISGNFPAWYLGHNPAKNVILASYEYEYARTWGRTARETLESVGQELFNVRVSRDSSAADDWSVEEYAGAQKGWLPGGGGMKTVGVGSGVTGRGADVLIIDDPVKDAAMARSRTYQRGNLEWYRGTAYPRLEAGGSVILLMTRWHQRDLAGILLQEDGTVEEGGQWEVIEFPAIATEHDVLGRAPGEALWPEMFPIEELMYRQNNMTPLWWAAEYQQRPRPEEGGLFQSNWIRSYYTTVEGSRVVHYLDDPVNPRRAYDGDCYRIITADLAVSLKETADYTCICVWLVTPDGDLLLEHVYHDRVAGPDQLPVLQRLNREYQPVSIGIEAVQYQLSLVQDAQRKGLPAIPLKPKGDKYSRAIPAAQRMRSGKVYFKARAPWRQLVDDEITDFPTGKHDEVPDNLSYAVEMQLSHTMYANTEVDQNAYVSYSDLSPTF